MVVERWGPLYFQSHQCEVAQWVSQQWLGKVAEVECAYRNIPEGELVTLREAIGAMAAELQSKGLEAKAPQVCQDNLIMYLPQDRRVPLGIP